MRVYHRALAPIELRQLAGLPAAGYRDRMIAHLKLDETTGTTATDGGLFGHHGTLLGGFDFTTHGLPGQYSGALDFDGQSNRIDLGALDFTGLGALTVSAWVRPTDPSRNQRVIAKDRVGTPGAFILRYLAATSSWQWQVYDPDHGSGGWRVVATTANLFDGAWHQLTGVLDAPAGQIRLYVDGTLAGTAPFSATALDDSQQERLVIGADSHPDDPDRFFAGAIDEVRLYGFAFGDADVAALHAAPSADFDLDGDGVPDAEDAFPADPTEWQDADFDGVGDNADAFPHDPSASGAVTWPFSVPVTGAYELWVTVPGGHNRTALARYFVSHAGGEAEVSLDQRHVSGEVYLGTWSFAAHDPYTLRLANAVDGYAVADRLTLRAAGGSTPSDGMALAYVHADHLGTPQVITGGQGEILWQGHYRPFGEVDVTTGLIANDLRFPGQLFDAESGLHYNYFRDYDPTLGRYVQSDPIGLAGGYNRFGYALQNPLSFWDPNGLSTLGTLNSMAWFRWSLSQDMGAPPEVYIPQKVNEIDEQTCELQCLLPIPEVDIVLATEIAAVTAVAVSTSEIAKVLAKEIGKRAVLALSTFTIAECLSKCRQGVESCPSP